MNHETIAALSPCHGLFDAKMIEAVNKIRPLAGINISPELVRMCNRLKDIVPAAVLAGIDRYTGIASAVSALTGRHAKIAKLADSILRVPPRR